MQLISKLVFVDSNILRKVSFGAKNILRKVQKVAS